MAYRFSENRSRLQCWHKLHGALTNWQLPQTILASYFESCQESKLKSISSLFGLFAILLLSATSYAQSVCPHCGQIHQSSHVSTAATYPVTTNRFAPVITTASPFSDFTSNANFSNNVTFTSNINSTGNAQVIAQQKANLAASTLNKGHVGGSLGPATHEGVGFSTSSSQQAIDAACYSGSPISAQGPGRPRIGTGVARGSDGWYACLLCL